MQSKSKIFKLTLAVAALLAHTATPYQIASFTDIHMNPSYDPSTSSNKCWGSNPKPNFFSQFSRIFLKSDPNAPLGRMGCDAPKAQIDAFAQIIQQKKPDIIFTAGDFVGHSIAGDYDDPSTGDKNLLKEVISQTASLLHSYFPNTLIIPTVGNNDYWYHDQAPFSADKNEYYSFVYDQWFSGSRGSDAIKQTFLYGGYYRVDVDDKLSVLALNTMYYASDNVASKQKNEGQDQLNWFESQLANSEASRKFIIAFHIYPGARAKGSPDQMWYPAQTQTYFDILKKYHDKIVIEIGGHDHIADVRYHNDQIPKQDSQASSIKLESASYYLHNLLVSPGLSSKDGSNPGIAFFQIDKSTFVPWDLQFKFIDLEKSYGLSSVPPLNQIPWFDMDFKNFGLQDLTPLSLHNFQNLLDGDQDLTLQYAVSKLGFNPLIKDEYDQAIDLMINDLEILTSKKDTYKLICQIHMSTSLTELNDCFDSKNQRMFEEVAIQYINFLQN